MLVTSILGLALGTAGCDSSSSGDGQSDDVLRILVTNDDGIDAEGIDAVVQALVDNPNNEVVVSAPAENSSGSGDDTIESNPECGTGAAMPASTASGYDENVWGVDGCPADAVLYALENLYPDAPPHVVLSGLNDGQNVGLVGEVGSLSQVSGTVGAAKTAACSGVPALASSQGSKANADPDFDVGVVEVRRWLEANRSALLAETVPLDTITSINIPSCSTGAVRGQEPVPLGTELPDGVFSLLQAQDCESMLENPQDDITAFFNGFVAVTPVPSNSSNTCDNLTE